MKPLLSIVIANYNYGSFIEQAIQSVLSQASDEVELIVCDGGSTDQSVEVIRRYAGGLGWWCSEKDGGQSAAFNKGFEHARGKYLTWLNADDLLVPGAVRAVVRELKRHPQCEWFTGNFVRFLETTHDISQIGWGPHFYPKWMQRRNSPLVTFGPSTVFSKNLWLRSGKIAEDLHFMMDNELWMRFVVAGVKQRRIRHFIWAFRMHEESKTAEFGEHKMDAEKLAKFNAEAKVTYARTGYAQSKFWRFMQLAGRVLDGSLVRRSFYLRNLKKLEDLNRFDDLFVLQTVGPGSYFKFMAWFQTALKDGGVSVRTDIHINHKVRAFLGRLVGISLPGCRRRRLIVCGGHRIESCAWPWNYGYEIIPMMWDLWPDNYAAFKTFVQRNRVKMVFCTSSQSARWITDNCPAVTAHWVPEAADTASLPMGKPLAERSIDILTYGRLYPKACDAAKDFARQHGYRYHHGAGSTFDELTATVRDAKVVVFYPLCDTNPEKAKGVETLTQRYWEAMFSGTVIVGRAPKELIDVCGYNPVVEAGDDVPKALTAVFGNLGDFQLLVNRNRATAEKKGDWHHRVGEVVTVLNEIHEGAS